ncbi:MAG: hypothetical protein C0434_07930 [Xanthomonadaceae bacterium]|nr:hypothetical protein [Xanthomonadaceae bacterium]
MRSAIVVAALLAPFLAGAADNKASTGWKPPSNVLEYCNDVILRDVLSAYEWEIESNREASAAGNRSAESRQRRADYQEMRLEAERRWQRMGCAELFAAQMRKS